MRTDIRFTVEEYNALPDTGPRYQLVDGELLMSPSPTFRHQDIQMRLALALANFVNARSLGKVLVAPLDVFLSDENVYQPDIVYISKQRRSIIVPEGLRGVPDLCVEILSPKTRTLDLTVKRLQYARFGLPELWIVDPDENTLRLFRLQDDPNQPARMLSALDTLTTPTLPEFSLALKEIFAN